MIHENILQRQPAHAIDQLGSVLLDKKEKQSYFFSKKIMHTCMLDALFLPRINYQTSLLNSIKAAHKAKNISANFVYKGKSYTSLNDSSISKQLDKTLHSEMDEYLAELKRENKAEVTKVSNYLTSVLSRATTQKELDILIPEMLLKKIKEFKFYALTHLCYPDQDMDDSEKNLNAFIEKNHSSILLIKKILTENLFYTS